MKICIISSLYAPFARGGAEIYAEKIAKNLSCGHEVFVITSRNCGIARIKEEVNGGVKIYGVFPLNLYSRLNDRKVRFFPSKLIWHAIDLFNLSSYFMIKKILRREKPDVVHTHTLAGLSDLAVFSAVKSLNLPLVHTCHDYALMCFYVTLCCPFWRGMPCKCPKAFCRIYRIFKNKIADSKPDIVTAPSRFVLDMHIKSGYFKHSEKVMLPYLAEFNASDYTLDGESVVKNNRETIGILYMGRLSKVKGVQVLISAFKEIINANVKLHIVGTGDYESCLKELARSDTRITFYGKIPNNETLEFYKKHDILVVPSIWYENSPMVIYEAFKSGMPVIGSRIGGIPELVQDNYNGFLFEAGNAGQLKNVLWGIISNPGQLRELGKQARESVKKYNVDQHLKSLNEIYKAAIILNEKRHR